MAASRICSVEGCDKQVRGAGYCQSHYMRYWRHGDPLAGGEYQTQAYPGRKCIVDGCEKLSNKGRYCPMHAERKRRYGDVNKGAFKPRGKCTLEGCQNKHYGRGYCLAHYKRWKKYGDPFAGGIPWGEARKFLDSILTTTTEECVAFPYGKAGGYGRVNIDGTPIGAHVYVATQAHGPKPSDKHEVCHSCGNGHEACVNPAHLYWGTRSDNIEDAFRHGRRKRAKHKTDGEISRHKVNVI